MGTNGKAGGPGPEKRELRTKFAIQALDLAQAFDSVLGVLTIGPHAYSPNLMAPEGPSTGGGKQALQHLRLVPARDGAPTLVVGAANQVDRTAELRTFEHLEALHRQRFRKTLELDRAEYERFLEQARSFFNELDFAVSLASVPQNLTPVVTPAAKAPASGGMLTGFLFGAVVTAVIGAVVLWLLLRQGH